MKELSKRNRRALFILGGFVTATILILYVLLPFFEAQQKIGGIIEGRETELQKSLQKLQLKDNYANHLISLDSLISDYRQKLLDAQDASNATVQLEKAVRSMAEQSGVQVTRSNPLPERKLGDGYAKITLQLNLETDLTQLINFLHSLSDHPKFLIVEEFTLASFRVRNQTRLQPRMHVSGFIRLS